EEIGQFRRVAWHGEEWAVKWLRELLRLSALDFVYEQLAAEVEVGVKEYVFARKKNFDAHHLHVCHFDVANAVVEHMAALRFVPGNEVHVPATYVKPGDVLGAPEADHRALDVFKREDGLPVDDGGNGLVGLLLFV